STQTPPLPYTTLFRSSRETPSETVRACSARMKIRGNQKSFQILIIMKIATVASAGRRRGRMRPKYIRHSEAPSTLAASNISLGRSEEHTSELQSRFDL